MSLTHSKAYIKVDGAQLETMPGAKLTLGGDKRTPVVGDNKIHGFSEVIEPSMLECEIVLKAGTSLAAIRDIVDATVTYEADTGQTYVMRNAFVTDALQLTAGDGGKVAVKMAGDPAEEMGV